MTYIRIFPLTKEPIQDPRGGWINFTDVSIDTNPKFQHLLTSHDFVILNQADELAALRAELVASKEREAKLREALESVDALVAEDMGDWYSVQFAHLPASLANLAHIRDAIQDTFEALNAE